MENLNLPVEQRASNALASLGAPTIDALIAKMETFRPVSESDITDKETYAPAWESLKEVRAMRMDIEKTGKSARADATAYGKAVIAAEKELVAVIEPFESALKDKTDAWKEKEEERKAAKRERLQRIEAAINAISSIPSTLFNATASEIASAYEMLNSRDLEAEGVFQEFVEKAKEEKAKVLLVLADAVEKAQKAEAQAAELAEMKRQQEEFSRQKAEFAEQQRRAELAAKAAENALLKAEKDKAEAEARALREAEAKRQQEEDARIAAEEKAAAEKAEQERQAALAPDKEKITAWMTEISGAVLKMPVCGSTPANELVLAFTAAIGKMVAQMQSRAEAL